MADQIVVLDSETDVAAEAVRRLIDALAAAIADRGEAHLCLTGGSTAVSLFRELRKPGYHRALDWGRVHLWWTDDRLVPVDHPESNVGLAYNVLLALSARSGESGTGGDGVDVDTDSGDLDALPINVENVHPYEIDEVLSESEPAQLAAQRYAEELEEFLPAVGDLPGFDVMMLGVGPDGHILSIFPNSRALKSDELVVAVPAPTHVEPHLERVTLNPKLLPATGLILVMVTGGAKAELLGEVLGESRDAARWPAQLARLPQSVWLLDRAASAKLSGVGQD